MSVPEQIPYVGYVANGQTTEFPITFDLHDPEYLIVTVNKEIPVVGTYTVDINSLKVVFATAPTDGTQVELYRETELNRDTNYQKYDNSFRAEAVNYDFDKIWHVLQEQDMIDAELLARLKGEIEWRRTHDANFDELAKMRDAQVFTGLKRYIDTITAASNPNIFDGVSAGVVFALDKKSVQTHLDEIIELLNNGHLDISVEAERAKQAEDLLNEKIDQKSNSLTNLIDSESERAKSAEQNLQLQITTGNSGIKYFDTEAQVLAFTPGESDPKQAYAFDTKKNYLWIGSNWKDEGKSPVDVARDYTNTAIEGIFTKNISNIAVSPIFGYGINTDTPETTKFTAPGDLRAYLKIDVSSLSSLIVSNATSASFAAKWKWIFRDANDAYISMSSTIGSGQFVIPHGAKWAYRTYQIGDAGAYENSNLSIIGVLSYSVNNHIDAAIKENNPVVLAEANDYTNTALYGNPEDAVSITAIPGFAVDTTPTKPNFLTPETASDKRKYISFDVSNYSHLTVSNSLTDSGVGSWYWVFETNTGGKIVSSSRYNGKFEIPANAVKAYRTVYYKSEFVEYDDIAHGLTITATPRKPRIQPQLNYLTQQINEIIDNGGASLAAFVALDAIIKKMEDMFVQKNFISPNDFEDSTQFARLKSAVDFVRTQGYGIIELGIDAYSNTNLWTFPEALTLPTNCWIYVNNSTVKRGNQVFDNIFRNDGIVPDPDPFKIAKELNPNANIRIFGNDKTLSIVDGNYNNAYTAPHPVNGGDPVPWVSDFYGWRAQSILFANTTGHRVYNLTLKDSTNWTISNEHGCAYAKFHDLIFRTIVKNGDGIDVRQGCNNIEIFNISGTTSDDMVACSALNNFVQSFPSGDYIFPTQVGGYMDRGFGSDITDVKIWNIRGNNSNGGVRLLWTGGSKMKNVSVNDVADDIGSFFYYAVYIHTGQYGGTAVMGDAQNITVNNVVSNKSDTVVKLDAPLKNCWFNKIIQKKATSTPIIQTGEHYAEDNVKRTNVKNEPPQ
ncbi:phage tail fiber protein [Acinetobacter baumannii]|uniref:phage tail fiber domain-containing protein n=1 Tax=Acinetobacter baumannii TaxID=470 RepID=UPI00244D4EE0|nr:phage tail fiber protein [Acinetobacter baumannii]MDH2463969.1 phage tail fiber protein [Acinetobacter baumannii]